MKDNKTRLIEQRQRDRARGIVQCNVKIRETDREAIIDLARRSRAGTLEPIQTTTEPTADPQAVAGAPQEQAQTTSAVTEPTAPVAPYRHRYVTLLIPDRGDCQIEIERHARILCQDKPARG